MRVTVLLLFFFPSLLYAQDPGLQASQIVTQQAQRDAQEAQRQHDIALQAHQQAMRTAQAAGTPPGVRASVTEKPRFSPKPGTYKGITPQLTITDRTKGAVIYFTTDGSIPTVKSQRYIAPIPLSATTTVRAVAMAPSAADSPIARGKYVVR